MRPKGWQLEARKVKSGGWGFGEGSSEPLPPARGSRERCGLPNKLWCGDRSSEGFLVF